MRLRLRSHRRIGPSFPYVAIQAASAVLWTPANLSVTPRILIQAENAVWSGSNLSSIAGTGSDAGAMTVAGTPIKGTASNGIDPIYVSTIAAGLTRTLAAWSSGKLSTFFFSKRVAGTPTGGMLSRAWEHNSTNDMVALYSYDGGTSLRGNRDVSTDNPPKAISSTESMPDTTSPHSVYMQVGTTNDFYSDGTQLALDVANTTGACPNYPSSVWKFLTSWITDDATYGEPSHSETFVMALFDNFLGTSDRQKMEGWAYWKYKGDASNLPGGHPYKSAPPTI